MTPRTGSGALRRLALVGVLASVGCGGGDKGGGVTNPPPPTLVVTTVDVTPGASTLDAGDSVQLAAVVKDQNGGVMSNQTVAWSSSALAVATVSSTGVVTAAAPGDATVTATANGKVGSAAISVRVSDLLLGSPTDPAVAAIPGQRFISRPQDYATDHPDVPGVSLSFNTLSVVIADDATVTTVNALLTEFNAKIVGGIPGKSGQAPGILFLRLPTKSHLEMIPRLAALRQRTGVVTASQDIILSPTDVPAPNGANPPQWQWTLGPSAGAWGPIAIRAPELWNLNDATRKAGATAVIGILDVGFAAHPDLLYSANLTPASASPTQSSLRHGTHVAGTIGAKFGNGVGVDGINPFAALVVDGLVSSSMAQTLSEFDVLLLARPDLRVVNLSLAYNWSLYNPPINTRTGLSGSFARQQAASDGILVRAGLQTLAAAGRALPVVVAAAGNDSRNGDQDAVNATPWANAALAQGAAPIIVVEAVGLNPPSSYARASFSNLGGHVSAPGVGILSTNEVSGYIALNGTSMATPHVTGLVSYLYSLDPALPAPTMTTNLVRDLLRTTATSLPVVAPMIDAFAAALSLDQIRGDHRTLGLLLDVDDGTVDGNTRLTSTGTVVTADAKGNGKIDMADFRRWRDWLLEAEQAPNLDLDGAADHPKKDLNGDGVVSASGAVENIHPRGDFNGDGVISRVKSAKVPGVKNGQPATDLEVLQQLFQDPDYQSSDLPGLVDSWDLDVDAGQCLALPGVSKVKTTVTRHGATSPIAVRTHVSTDPRHVITLPMNLPAGQDVLVEALDAAGNTIASERETFFLEIGGDWFHDPVCNGFFIQVGFPTIVTPGTATQLDIKAGDRDLTTGVSTFLPGIKIDVVVAGGTVVPANGQTNASGQFLSTATLSQGNNLLTLFITATKPDGSFLTKIVSASASCGRVVSGNLHVTTPAELASAANVKEVTGSLDIGGAFPSIGSVDLPCLERVGSLEINSLRAPGIVKLSSLTSAGGALDIEGSGLLTLDMPLLSQVAELFVVPLDLTALNLPNLTTTGANFGIGGRALQTITLRAVNNVNVLIRDNPALRTVTVGSIDATTIRLRGNPALQSLTIGTMTANTLEVFPDGLRGLDGIANATLLGFFFGANDPLGEAAALAFANRISVRGVCSWVVERVNFKCYTGPPWH